MVKMAYKSYLTTYMDELSTKLRSMLSARKFTNNLPQFRHTQKTNKLKVKFVVKHKITYQNNQGKIQVRPLFKLQISLNDTCFS